MGGTTRIEWAWPVKNGHCCARDFALRQAVWQHQSKRNQILDDKECANDVYVLDELIMGIIETRGDESLRLAALSESAAGYPRDPSRNTILYFLYSTIIASGVMKSSW